MKKRVVFVSMAMAAALLTACGGTQKSETTTAQTTVQTTAGQSTEAQTAAVSAENTSSTQTVDKQKVYVSAEWIKSVMDGKQPESSDYKIIEVAWGKESDDKAYTKGHIPGAYHLNTDDLESDKDWNLRTPEEIGKLLASYGITKDTTVILYGADGVDSADDRAAFAFLWAGVENVKCLDGGFKAWEKAGYNVETTSNKPVATTKDFGVKIPAHPEYIMDIETVKKKLADDPNFKLVSIRSKDEFDGKTSGYSYIDRAGEPDGAIWGHDTDDGSYTNADGTIVKIDTLEKYLGESGASMKNDLSFYCGTGWRAAVPFLIAYENGYKNISVYDGGWYQWQMDPNDKVQLGDPKSGNMKEVTVKDLTTDKAKKK